MDATPNLMTFLFFLLFFADLLKKRVLDFFFCKAVFSEKQWFFIEISDGFLSKYKTFLCMKSILFSRKNYIQEKNPKLFFQKIREKY